MLRCIRRCLAIQLRGPPKGTGPRSRLLNIWSFRPQPQDSGHALQSPTDEADSPVPAAQSPQRRALLPAAKPAGFLAWPRNSGLVASGFQTGPSLLPNCQMSKFRRFPSNSSMRASVPLTHSATGMEPNRKRLFGVNLQLHAKSGKSNLPVLPASRPRQFSTVNARIQRSACCRAESEAELAQPPPCVCEASFRIPLVLETNRDFVGISDDRAPFVADSLIEQICRSAFAKTGRKHLERIGQSSASEPLVPAVLGSQAPPGVSENGMEWLTTESFSPSPLTDPRAAESLRSRRRCQEDPSALAEYRLADFSETNTMTARVNQDERGTDEERRAKSPLFARGEQISCSDDLSAVK